MISNVIAVYGDGDRNLLKTRCVAMNECSAYRRVSRVLYWKRLPSISVIRLPLRPLQRRMKGLRDER